MIRKLFFATIAVGMLSACGDTRGVYPPPNSSLQTQKVDVYECKRDTRQVAYSFGTRYDRGEHAKNFLLECLEARGWNFY